jgi:hypothetical protein
MAISIADSIQLLTGQHDRSNESFNPEPQATAVLMHDRQPETAGASGFGLNKEEALSN